MTTNLLTTSLRPALFLDRDGTVIVEKHYLSNPDDVELLPTAGETIARLNSLGLPVVIVTNQAGVARNLFPESRLGPIHARLDQLLAAHGARIDHYEYCPHHPTEGIGPYRIDCDCRKPKPGMLLKAASHLDIDLTRSGMIGDRLGDLKAGANAGCRTALVLTGYGSQEQIDHADESLRSLGAFTTLADAVTECLSRIGDFGCGSQRLITK